MAAITPAYSTLISCIYDQPEPVGYLGRGTHYSIFRSVEWRDVIRQPLVIPQVHDFAVIWDEDHDTRVIPVIEKIYMKSLLSPVQFIGERKGTLTVLVAAKFHFGIDHNSLRAYKAALQEEANEVNGDYWNVELGMFDRSEVDHQTEVEGIINDRDFKVKTYLRSIDFLWNLGTRAYVPPRHAEVPTFPPFPTASPFMSS